MKRTTTIGSKRKLTALAVLVSIVAVAMFFVVAWVVLSDTRPPDLSGHQEVAGRSSRSLDRVGFDDFGPGSMHDRMGPPPVGGATLRQIRQRRTRIVFSLAGLGALLVLVGGFLFWSVATAAIDRSVTRAQRFTADMAHELKTPLAVMQSLVEHAMRHSGGITVEQLGADVLEEVSRLKTLVSRLLLLAQSDAGKLPIKRERIDLSAIFRLIAEDLSLLAGDTPVETKVADGVFVMGDRSFLAQAFQNLVSNAVKYNRSGFTIEFTLSVEGGDAVVLVSNGVDPFAPPDIERMFDRFYRGDNEHGSKLDGAGLGLSLAKEIINAFGGHIGASIDGDRISIRTELPCA